MDDHVSIEAACAACDLTERLRADLHGARQDLRAAEEAMNRAIDLSSYSPEMARQVHEKRTRVEALILMLAELIASHQGDDHAA